MCGTNKHVYSCVGRSWIKSDETCDKDSILNDEDDFSDDDSHHKRRHHRRHFAVEEDVEADAFDEVDGSLSDMELAEEFFDDEGAESE